MNDSLKKEIQNIIEHLKLNYTVDDFDKSVNWYQWNQVSKYVNLSESFIERYKDKMDWDKISEYQQLSESFIERFKNKVNWSYISEYQILSESFIERFKNNVDWDKISEYQKLSESFIEKYSNYIYWSYISIYQKISEEFRVKHNLKIPENNTMYMTNQEISDLIPDCYERDENYIIAYKNVRRDRYSHYNYQYKYDKGGIYDCHCDCNNNNEYSFGLSLWTKEQAKKFNYNGIVVKCRVKVEDIGAVVHAGNKLRCKRIEVLN